MSYLDPQQSLSCLSTYFQENRETLSRITESLAKDAAGFKAACKHQRISVMSGGLQSAVLANLRFWTELQTRFSMFEPENSTTFSSKMNTLAEFATRQSKMLLSLNGDIRAIISINQALLGSTD